MNWAVVFSLTGIGISISLIVWALIHGSETSRQSVRGAATAIMICAAVLVGVIMPSGFVSSLTQGVVVLPALVFLTIDFRETFATKRGPRGPRGPRPPA